VSKTRLWSAAPAGLFVYVVIPNPAALFADGGEGPAVRFVLAVASVLRFVLRLVIMALFR
jgi:hypothetical protein